MAALKEMHQVLTDVEIQPYVDVVAMLLESVPQGRLPLGGGTLFFFSVWLFVCLYVNAEEMTFSCF
jgi:hypothetical protein